MFFLTRVHERQSTLCTECLGASMLQPRTGVDEIRAETFYVPRSKIARTCRIPGHSEKGKPILPFHCANETMSDEADLRVLCSASRNARHSRVLGRTTCLTEKEAERAMDRGRDVGDRKIAKRIGVEHTALRPVMPSAWAANPKSWLNQHDIDATMRQFDGNRFQCTYLGVHCRDFFERKVHGECVSLCNGKPILKLWENRKLGILIVNLDLHTGPGTHWVAVTVDCRSPRSAPDLCYYDSLGKPPPKEWEPRAWACLVSELPKSVSKRAISGIRHNTTVHQRCNTECGVFAMMFAASIADGADPEKYCKLPLTDEDAFRHRSTFFEDSPLHQLARSVVDVCRIPFRNL